MHECQCNHIAPVLVGMAGLTHLNLAFASINSATFAVMPAYPADEALYAQFTALKTPMLQT